MCCGVATDGGDGFGAVKDDGDGFGTVTNQHQQGIFPHNIFSCSPKPYPHSHKPHSELTSPAAAAPSYH